MTRRAAGSEGIAGPAEASAALAELSGCPAIPVTVHIEPSAPKIGVSAARAEAWQRETLKGGGIPRATLARRTARRSSMPDAIETLLRKAAGESGVIGMGGGLPSPRQF